MNNHTFHVYLILWMMIYQDHLVQVSIFLSKNSKSAYIANGAFIDLTPR